jgi:hypothetical protein
MENASPLTSRKHGRVSRVKVFNMMHRGKGWFKEHKGRNVN